MNIVEMIIKVDNLNRIIDATYHGAMVEWFENIDWNMYVHQSMTDIFGTDFSEHILEFHNRFFRCQMIDDINMKTYLFSHESVMKQLYEETLNKVSEGIQIYDRNGYFVYGNSASENLGGYHNKDFIGRHLLDIYDLSEEFSTTLTVLRTNKPVLNRCDNFRGKDNKELITINSGYPLEVDDKLLGAASFESDLTVINNIKNKSFNLEAFIRNDQPVIESTRFGFGDIIHKSLKMAELIQFSKKIALTNTNILISGETGTGKELFAQSIHNYSPRRDQAFVDINCSAVPSNLVESLFFGTEKGAYTGSVKKKGLLELADGGTLFLDEINSMGLDMQAKLLRALQEKRFQRVGGHDYIECNVRIIAASNENLRELSSSSDFRKDFYYRISTLVVDIPPLRERRQDIAILAEFFIKELSKTYGRQKLEFAKSFMTKLENYDWPGNVRELSHALEYAINHISEDDNKFQSENLPDYITEKSHVRIKEQSQEVPFLLDEADTLVSKLEKVEAMIINQALKDSFGNVTRAAKELGLSRQSLQYRMSKSKE